MLGFYYFYKNILQLKYILRYYITEMYSIENLYAKILICSSQKKGNIIMQCYFWL